MKTADLVWRPTAYLALRTLGAFVAVAFVALAALLMLARWCWERPLPSAGGVDYRG